MGFVVSNTERLIQLNAHCTECGKREARRVAAWRLELYRNEDPDRVVETIRCRCGHQYAVLVRAYQQSA